MSEKDYTPSYVWPNPAFPFRVYLDDHRLRIFIIENIQHNWNWLSEYSSRFRDTDLFLVYCGWYHSEAWAKEAEKVFSVLRLNKAQFFFMFNSNQEKDNFESYGFKGEVLNQNAWLDENHVMMPRLKSKRYNAIYVARRSAFKRHHLASKVQNLALIAGINHGNDLAPVPSSSYLNDKPLSPVEVCEKINEAHCGLILSQTEGACFASSEYLLCGIPVVSTPSNGGRDYWYDDYNAIICEPTEDAIAAGVEQFLQEPRDPWVIRNRHIALASGVRKKFVLILAKILNDHGVKELDAAEYFHENFFHKLRRSSRPDFESIWPKSIKNTPL